MHESYQPITGLLSEFIILTDFKMHGVSSCYNKQYYTKSCYLIGQIYYPVRIKTPTCQFPCPAFIMKPILTIRQQTGIDLCLINSL
jgi:hypothetical protein